MEQNANGGGSVQAGQGPPAGFSLDRFSVRSRSFGSTKRSLVFMPPLVRLPPSACRAVWVLAGATHRPRTAQSRVGHSEWIRVRPDVHEPPPFDRPAYCANVSFPAETLGSRVRWCCPGSPCVRAAG